MANRISEFKDKVMKEEGYRTNLFFAVSVLITIGFALYNAFLGVYQSSLWYGSIALYFICLALLRIFNLLFRNVIRHRYSDDPKKEQRKGLQLYWINGVFLIILVIALSFSVLQMVTSSKPVVSGTIMAITNAAYSFYKITMAVIHLVKATKKEDKAVQAIRNVSFADAMVSMLTLSVTLLTTFGDGSLNHLMIVFVSVFVSLVIFFVGIRMFIRGNQALKHQPK